MLKYIQWILFEEQSVIIFIKKKKKEKWITLNYYFSYQRYLLQSFSSNFKLSSTLYIIGLYTEPSVIVITHFLKYIRVSGM